MLHSQNTSPVSIYIQYLSTRQDIFDEMAGVVIFFLSLHNIHYRNKLKLIKIRKIKK